MNTREETLPIRLSLRSDLTLYLLGEESVLFSRRSGRLYGLERTATVALLRLEEGEKPDALSHSLGLDNDSARVVSELASILAGEESCDNEYESELLFIEKPPGRLPRLPRYRLLNTVFTLDGPQDLLRERIAPFLDHLRTDTPGEDTPEDLIVSLEARGPSWRLLLNGALQEEGLATEMLLPLLCARLRSFAYQSCPYLLAVHAAVVTRNGCTAILAGRSGSGKSTLAAALLAKGYQLVSDEPAVIDAASVGVLPMPFGLGLKAGSWPVVMADHPRLDRLPIHLRFDGQPIRFLMPESSDHRSAPCVATHLIFPSFSPRSAAGIEPLGPVSRLRAIAEAGYQVPGLDEKRVERILAWLSGLHSFSLTYRSTQEALDLLEVILSGKGMDTLPAATAAGKG